MTPRFLRRSLVSPAEDARIIGTVSFVRVGCAALARPSIRAARLNGRASRESDRRRRPEIERDRDGSSRVANIRFFEKFTLVGPRVGVLKVTREERAIRLCEIASLQRKASATRIEFPRLLAKRARGRHRGRLANRKQGKKKSHFPLPGS